MVIAALFRITKKQKPKYLTNDEQINKMWHIHAMEYYAAVKRNGALIHNTARINLETLC